MVLEDARAEQGTYGGAAARGPAGGKVRAWVRGFALHWEARGLGRLAPGAWEGEGLGLRGALHLSGRQGAEQGGRAVPPGGWLTPCWGGGGEGQGACGPSFPLGVGIPALWEPCVRASIALDGVALEYRLLPCTPPIRLSTFPTLPPAHPLTCVPPAAPSCRSKWRRGRTRCGWPTCSLPRWRTSSPKRRRRSAPRRHEGEGGAACWAGLGCCSTAPCCPALLRHDTLLPCPTAPRCPAARCTSAAPLRLARGGLRADKGACRPDSPARGSQPDVTLPLAPPGCSAILSLLAPQPPLARAPAPLPPYSTAQSMHTHTTLPHSSPLRLLPRRRALTRHRTCCTPRTASWRRCRRSWPRRRPRWARWSSRSRVSGRGGAGAGVEAAGGPLLLAAVCMGVGVGVGCGAYICWGGWVVGRGAYGESRWVDGLAPGGHAIEHVSVSKVHCCANRGLLLCSAHTCACLPPACADWQERGSQYERAITGLEAQLGDLRRAAADKEDELRQAKWELEQSQVGGAVGSCRAGCWLGCSLRARWAGQGGAGRGRAGRGSLWLCGQGGILSWVQEPGKGRRRCTPAPASCAGLCAHAASPPTPARLRASLAADVSGGARSAAGQVSARSES